MIHDSIKLFNSKIKSATRSRSKDFRITIDEATEILTEINELLLDLNKQKTEVIRLQEQNTFSGNIEIKTSTF